MGYRRIRSWIARAGANAIGSALCVLVLCGSGTVARAQGCVAAHSSQRAMDELCDTDNSQGRTGSGFLHRLTLTIGYRNFSSEFYFIGTQEIPRSPAVENHQNIWDVDVDFRLSHRWSLIADVPVYLGSRNQIYPPSGVFDVAGIGDMTVGGQMWIFRPPTENNGNIAFSLSVKIPTGVDNATGAALLHGQTVIATADQSLQPGDGGWGAVLASQAYKQVYFHTMLYFEGQYLFNPRDTNGVATFRSQPGQGVMSVTDQYLYRFGFAHGIPKIRHLSLSLGGRMEGVPVRDAFGASDGFRRPGYILSIDPGLMYSFYHETISINGPWALLRDREPSVPELAVNNYKGDAFFANYTIIASVSHHF
jgi:hypothetical protein